MPKQIVWSPLAEQDFENILEYLAENWNNSVTNQLIDLTEEVVGQISNNPRQYPLMLNRLMQMQVSLKTAELFLTSKAILTDWLQNLTMRNNGFSSVSSGHILSMSGLMQTRFKNLKS